MICAQVLMLVNRSTGSEFFMARGLKQGCPLSPLLYNLMVESFPIMIKQFEEK